MNSIKIRSIFLVANLFFGLSMTVNAEAGKGSSYLDAGVYYSDIELPLSFEKEQIKALESGIVFNFELRFEIINVRNWRPDRSIGALTQTYTIEFNAFTRRYSVTNNNTGRQVSMSTVKEVVGYLSNIKKLPLVDDSLLSLEANYRVFLNSNLRARDVSQWMKTISFWRESLDSDLEQIQWQLFN